MGLSGCVSFPPQSIFSFIIKPTTRECLAYKLRRTNNQLMFMQNFYNLLEIVFTKQRMIGLFSLHIRVQYIVVAHHT